MSLRCINCDIRVTRIRRHLVSHESEALRDVIRLWTYPREVTNTDYICQACWELGTAQATGANNVLEHQERGIGHSHICVGCGRSILRRDSRTIIRDNVSNEDSQIVNIISGWIHPRQLTSTDQACVPCWLRAKRVLQRHQVVDETRDIEEERTCVNCNVELSPRSGHILANEEESLVNMIKCWNYPYNVNPTDYICHACWQLANEARRQGDESPEFELQPHPVDPHDSNSEQPQAGSQEDPTIGSLQAADPPQADDPPPADEPPQVDDPQDRNTNTVITLMTLRRAAATTRHCVFPNCNNVERFHVPDLVRSNVVKEYNYYIPRSARICSYHSGCNRYEDLYASSNSYDTFNSSQIEDLVFILTENTKNFNFEDVTSIPDHLLHYWIGLTKIQHNQILCESGLNNVRRGGFALTALLCKLRTGDSGERLSALFEVPRRTMETLMDIAREYLFLNFVPRHLGLQHITRDQVALKNSIIANGLFGNPESPLEERRAIVICDGTYIYTQKSSNYLFQKSTYSMHKYRNLVKPFMIVCCDGHILDVLGPFPATTNDATIMSSWIDEAAVLEFFKEEDIFILDRGFRDCIDKIHDCGFEAHMPETISPGHSQLTTLEGNRSRCVTINRWVVEAVNGRVKRDYKIFRQEYFNRAGPHLMKDFKIAAALLNTFATCVNCNVELSPRSGHILANEEESLVNMIKCWNYPYNVNPTDYICHACWQLANEARRQGDESPEFELQPHPVDPHDSNSEQPQAGSQEDPTIGSLQAADPPQADDPPPADEPPQVDDPQDRNTNTVITLMTLRRAAATTRHCVFPNCNNVERFHVPDLVRSNVVKEYNYYIPRSARICSYHSGCNRYEDLYASSNSYDTFNSSQIEDLVFILTENTKNFNFEDVTSIPDHLLHYWIGLTKIQHNQILCESGLNNVRRGGFALTALLCKLRTGDSGERLSALFEVPRRTMETLMDIAREYLFLNFVPRHLGLQHITRDQVALKNSIIANGLFGNPESPLEERRAIVICDGTYIYTQKSSNYLFQKSTYSMHKYRNLVKPFMIVCCDGHILDVLGPFPATTNDATIMSSWIDEAAVLEFFKEEDIFILDRGFRDCIDKIHDCGFEAHMPETISPGHSQLTTLEGNRSRCVTINRWVVEAVNGRVKRDYKIFRQEYFNRAGPHLMKDFKIAAALLNTFATCVNCNVELSPRSGHILANEEESLVNMIKCWNYPYNVNPTDYICHACWQLANEARRQGDESPEFELQPHPVDPHDSNSEQPQAGSQEDPTIGSLQAADPPQADDPPPADEPPQVDDPQDRNTNTVITLMTLRRAAATTRHCVFPNCNNVERFHVPDLVRSNVVKEYNYYIPRSARICSYHSGCNRYEDLYASSNSYDTFNSSQIEDLVFILTENTKNFNFEDVTSIPDHLLHYWIGLTKIQHNQILCESGLNNVRRGGFALTALLCKLRTGDSGERLSALFEVPRRTMETLMDIAREYLFLNFVPRHLGLQHITRDQVALKNSIIANGLFGNPESPLEERRAIVICDGTYIYTQKSSNYLFQKSTYSMHKYRNLVKPFMIVCCDGHILDVLGPFPATTNDATIMSSWIDEAAVLEFFKEEDIFILDRGFRDCIDKIHDCGFEAHMPETISPGHSQLTTLEGNRSRCVTINRWVVEAVNGRVKRDYKIFRQEYFNRAGPHLMKDFKIAAALLNTFATPFTDSVHADEIVSIVNERLFLTNTLASIVADQNLHRRSAYFNDITTADVSFPQLTMEDLVLFACGTYQIRQARSYIGEHLRFHGVYETQVCRENVVDLSQLDGEAPMLIRAKIKSRHISRKIYFVFVALDRTQVGRRAIIGYCCNCIVGLRTVGCCSHVMSIIWYLGYARHLDNVSPPAHVLDGILVRLET